MRKPTPDYKTMLHAVDNPWCWLCGRTHYSPHPVWFGPWIIHRAHIVNKPRVEDRRVVNLLCPLCHLAETAYGSLWYDNQLYPEITTAHMLWLKQERDSEHFDLDFLSRHTVRKLPSPRRPADFYLQQYVDRHPQNNSEKTSK